MRPFPPAVAIILYLTCAAMLIGGQAQESPARDGDAAPPDAPPVAIAPKQFGSNWIDYRAMCDRIWDLPDWPFDRDFTESLWNEYLKIADCLQGLAAEQIADVFRIYMVYGAQRDQDEREKGTRKFTDPFTAIGWQTHPLVLNRLMFELPDEPMEPAAVAAMGRERVYLNGLFPVHHDDAQLPFARSFSAPVTFDDDGTPALSLRRTKHVAWTGGDPYVMYQPHLEFEYFHDRFPLRDLSHLVDGRITWKDVVDRSRR